MLAINQKMGYQPQAGKYVLIRWLKNDIIFVKVLFSQLFYKTLFSLTMKHQSDVRSTVLRSQFSWCTRDLYLRKE